MWRFLNAAFQTKHALENSFPKMPPLSELYSPLTDIHIHLSHHSILAHDWRRIDKPLKTHPPPTTEIMWLITAQLCHSDSDTRAGGEGGARTRTETGAKHETRRETATWTSETLLLNQKTRRPIGRVNEASSASCRNYCIVCAGYFKNAGFCLGIFVPFFVMKRSI